MYKDYPRIRAAAIIERNGSVLLARHEKAGRSYWVLPGGGVEFGETVAQALVREMREEADLEVMIGDLVMVNDSIPPDRHRHIVNFYFLAEIVSGKLKVPRDDKRLRGMQFVEAEKLENITLYPDVRRPLYNGIVKGFPASGLYLGNLWEDMCAPDKSKD